jgi:ABC-type transport system involved in multi-copper enzyme maturation permease subunit
MAPRKSPGTFYASLRILDLSLGEMLWSRRTIFMGLVVGLPVVIALVVRLIILLGAPGVRVNGMAVDGPTMFGLMIWAFYLRFIVPVLGVFYGISLIADEVDDKTITYLFTRPVPRGAVLLGKYFAYLVCTVFVVLPSVVLVWFMVASIRSSLAANFLDMAKDLGLLAIGLAVYGAVFAFVGSAVKRPLLIGLAFVFGWEPAMMALPGYLKRFTVAYYLQGLVPQAMPSDSAMSLVQSIFREFPPVTDSLIWMTAMTLFFLWLAARSVRRREYVLEQ